MFEGLQWIYTQQLLVKKQWGDWHPSSSCIFTSHLFLLHASCQNVSVPSNESSYDKPLATRCSCAAGTTASLSQRQILQPALPQPRPDLIRGWLQQSGKSVRWALEWSPHLSRPSSPWVPKMLELKSGNRHEQKGLNKYEQIREIFRHFFDEIFFSLFHSSIISPPKKNKKQPWKIVPQKNVQNGQVTLVSHEWTLWP